LDDQRNGGWHVIASVLDVRKYRILARMTRTTEWILDPETGDWLLVETRIRVLKRQKSSPHEPRIRASPGTPAGRQAGGYARNAALTKQRKREIARIAAKALWAKRRAAKKGTT
jgi:hypothetical protein